MKIAGNVRPAESKDVESMLNVKIKHLPALENQRASMSKDYAESLVSGSTWAFVFVDSNGVIYGFTRLDKLYRKPLLSSVATEPYLYVKDMWVWPGYGKQGIGSDLHQAAMRLAMQLSLPLQLRAKGGSVAFWRDKKKWTVHAYDGLTVMRRGIPQRSRSPSPNRGQ